MYSKRALGILLKHFCAPKSSARIKKLRTRTHAYKRRHFLLLLLLVKNSEHFRSVQRSTNFKDINYRLCNTFGTFDTLVVVIVVVAISFYTANDRHQPSFGKLARRLAPACLTCTNGVLYHRLLHTSVRRDVELSLPPDCRVAALLPIAGNSSFHTCMYAQTHENICRCKYGNFLLKNQLNIERQDTTHLETDMEVTLGKIILV